MLTVSIYLPLYNRFACRPSICCPCRPVAAGNLREARAPAARRWRTRRAVPDFASRRLAAFARPRGRQSGAAPARRHAEHLPHESRWPRRVAQVSRRHVVARAGRLQNLRRGQLQEFAKGKAMNTAAQNLLVRKTLVVNAPAAHAFTVFTERFNAWWPRSHHLGGDQEFTAIIEPRAGGRWY